jgi:hypothetical protein
MTARSKADQAYKMILDAGTATYWVKEIKRITGKDVIKGDWKNNPEFVERVIKANGLAPS